jgi:hypothetical protein
MVLSFKENFYQIRETTDDGARKKAGKWIIRLKKK